MSVVATLRRMKNLTWQILSNIFVAWVIVKIIIYSVAENLLI